MGIGTVAAYGRQSYYHGCKAAGGKKTGDCCDGTYGGFVKMREQDNVNRAAGAGKWHDGHRINFEKTLSCRYAAESTEKDPVVEVSAKRHGRIVTEKVYLNDVNPRKATQMEMCALFYHQDQVDGTEGSYERLMQYAQTAKRHGYWDGNDSYGAFSESTYDWSEMLCRVGGDCRKFGLTSQAHECERLNASMFKVTLKNIDFNKIKPVDMREKTTLTPPDLKLPDIPVGIGEALAGLMFPFTESGERIRNFDWETENDIWFSMEYRIEKALNENGGRESIEKSWDTAIAALEDMLAELEDYFGDGLAEDPEVGRNVQEMKDFYQTVIQGMKEARDEALQVEQSTEVQDEEEDDLRSMLLDYMAELFAKIINGETDQEFAIGSIALTIEEWEKLIDKIDEIDEEIRAQIKEDIRKIKEAEGRTDTERETIEESTLLTSEVVTSSFGKGTADNPAPSYITCFTAEGIITAKKGMPFGQYLWKLDYENEGDYEKVMDMIHSFPSDWNLRFASNESFWRDYLDDQIDKDDFIQHMKDYTDQGSPNYLIEQNGSTYINREALKYSRYLNDPETKMYTAQEFMGMIAGRIEANKKGLRQ